MTTAQHHFAPLSTVKVQGYPITLGLLKQRLTLVQLVQSA